MLLSSQGIILKVFPYSNTSVICNVFTNDYGKLTFIAKGVRKPNNPLLSILQPFNLLELQYYYKKDRNMQLIKEADILISFDNIRENFSSIVVGSHIINIINRIFEQDYPNETIFRLVYKTLHRVSDQNDKNKLFFIFFIFHLLKQLGFMPNINQCHVCNKTFSDKAIFSYSLKSLMCSSCDANNPSEFNMHLDIKNLEFLNLFDKTNINKISDLKISSKRLYEIYNFLISFMRCHIKYMNNIKGIDSIEKIYYEH